MVEDQLAERFGEAFVVEVDGRTGSGHFGPAHGDFAFRAHPVDDPSLVFSGTVDEKSFALAYVRYPCKVLEEAAQPTIDRIRAMDRVESYPMVSCSGDFPGFRRRRIRPEDFAAITVTMYPAVFREGEPLTVARAVEAEWQAIAAEAGVPLTGSFEVFDPALWPFRSDVGLGEHLHQGSFVIGSLVETSTPVLPGVNEDIAARLDPLVPEALVYEVQAICGGTGCPDPDARIGLEELRTRPAGIVTLRVAGRGPATVQHLEAFHAVVVRELEGLSWRIEGSVYEEGEGPLVADREAYRKSYVWSSHGHGDGPTHLHVPPPLPHAQVRRATAIRPVRQGGR
jgi:hypothetical protein